MLSQKRNLYLSQKLITLLLIVKLMLVGVQADNRIQQGDAPIEVLIWVINQCVPILQKVDKLENKQKQSQPKNESNKK